MKKVFIYYSLSHNGDCVSDKLRQLGYEIIKVETKDQLPQKGLFKLYLKYGFKAMGSKTLELKNFVFNQNDYDEIVIGSPIWASCFACPINTVLKQINTNKIKAFVLYSDSGKARIVTKKIKKNYPNARIIHLKAPLKKPEEMKKLSI